ISHAKIPGENWATGMVIVGLVTVPLAVCTCTWIGALVAPTNSTGNCALITPGAAEKRGAATPLTSSVAPASVVGSVVLGVVAVVPSVREVPKTSTIVPGARTGGLAY